MARGSTAFGFTSSTSDSGQNPVTRGAELGRSGTGTIDWIARWSWRSRACVVAASPCQTVPMRTPGLLAVALILTLLTSVTSDDAFAETIACSLLQAQIYDGIPGPGVLVGPSTGGCLINDNYFCRIDDN